MLRFQGAVATDELELVATDDEERDEEILLGDDEMLLRDEEIEELELDVATLEDDLDEELVVLPQAVPATTGISAEAAPFEP